MPTPYHRARIWAIERLPDGVVARPGEWLLALFCVLGGLRAVAKLGASPALTELLPFPLYRLWGACLLFGGLALVCGLTSIRIIGDRHVVTRVPCYKLGLRLLMLASATYSASLIWVAGPRAVDAALFPLLFALFCLVRLMVFGGRR